MNGNTEVKLTAQREYQKKYNASPAGIANHAKRNAVHNPKRPRWYRIAGGKDVYDNSSKEAKAAIREQERAGQGRSPGEYQRPNLKSNPPRTNPLRVVSRKGELPKYVPQITRETIDVSGEDSPLGEIYAIFNPDNSFTKKNGKTHEKGLESILRVARRQGRTELLHHRRVPDRHAAETMLLDYLGPCNLREFGHTDVGTECFYISHEDNIKAIDMIADLVNDPEWEGIVDLGDATYSAT